MKEFSVAEYASYPQNIWGRTVSTTIVYTAIEAGRLRTKKVGKNTIIIDQIVDGVIEDRVLIRPDKPADDGFQKPEHTLPIPDTGEVVHVGPGKINGQPMVLEPGMRVKFNNNKVVLFTHEGEKYFILFQPDVHLIL